jgi:hypothetical protein
MQLPPPAGHLAGEHRQGAGGRTGLCDRSELESSGLALCSWAVPPSCQPVRFRYDKVRLTLHTSRVVIFCRD